MSVIEPNGEHTLEHQAFQVEEGAISIEAKVDEIITGNAEVKAQLKQRTSWFVITASTFLIILIVLCLQLYRLNAIASRNRATNMNTNEIVRILDNATGPEAQARSAKTLQGAIDDIRHSLDCNTDYLKYNEVSDSCKPVIDRDEALRP